VNGRVHTRDLEGIYENPSKENPQFSST